MGEVRRLICLICVAPLAVACGSTPSSTVSPTASASPTISHSVLLVFTKWAPDANVRGGLEPGYKPALTGLTGHDISNASAEIDMTGINWVINVSFTPRGRELFRQLTNDSVSACPGPTQDCPKRHLTIWLDLSQTDIDSWSDPTFAAKVSQPYDLACLAHRTASLVCPELLTNPTIRDEIAGGTTMIAGNFTKQSATELADSINSTAHA
jgi:preprotein translocase subunit SecD